MNRFALLVLAFCLPAAMAQTPAASPAPATNAAAWLEKIDLFGDIRGRHEYTSKSKANDSDRHQERLRVRFGLNAKVNETVKARIRLAGSDGQSPISTNTTLTDNANKKGLFIDQALIEWTPAAGQIFTLGKMENNLRVLGSSQLIYDVDYTPEGASYGGKFGSVFVNVMGASIQERVPQTSAAPSTDGSSEPDSWLMAGVVGYKADLSESMNLMVGAGYHNYTALKKNAALTTGFLGNSNAGARYLHDYQIGEIVAELKMKTGAGQFSVYGDFANNFYLEEDNMAYIAGVNYSTLNDAGKPVWTFGYAYISVDKDAVVSAVNNSDMASGADGAWAHMVQVGRNLSSNTSLTLTWYDSHVDANGAPFTTQKGLLDLVVSF